MEDLLIAAHADAKRKLEAQQAEEMEKVTGGMALPGGLEAAVLAGARPGLDRSGAKPRH